MQDAATFRQMENRNINTYKGYDVRFEAIKKFNDIEISNDVRSLPRQMSKSVALINDYLNSDWRELIITANTSWTSVSEFVHDHCCGGACGGSGTNVGILGWVVDLAVVVVNFWMDGFWAVVGNNYAALLVLGTGAGVGNHNRNLVATVSSSHDVWYYSGRRNRRKPEHTPENCGLVLAEVTLWSWLQMFNGGVEILPAQYGQAGESSSRLVGAEVGRTPARRRWWRCLLWCRRCRRCFGCSKYWRWWWRFNGPDSGATGNAGNGGSGVIILRWYGNAALPTVRIFDLKPLHHERRNGHSANISCP